MRSFRPTSARPTRSTRLGAAPCLVLLLAAVAGLVFSPVPASAEVLTPVRPAESDRTVASFDITGVRCSIEVVRERDLRNGTTVINAIESGRTEATIGLMTGILTLRSTTVIQAAGSGIISGSWTLDPDGSTGTIAGSFRGPIDAERTAEVRSVGRGRRSLSGVSVTLNTVATVEPNRGDVEESADDGDCEGGASFVGSGEAVEPIYRAPLGAVVSESIKSFDNTVADLTETIEANPNLRLIATVDHAAGAASRGLVLPPTTELFFGNPRLGTPLMQAAQTAGIDLPQKMLVWEDLFGVVRVAYNSVVYLESRHGIDGADPQLAAIAGALAGLSGVATGVPSSPVIDGQPVRDGYGLVTLPTDRSADEAFAAIVGALEAAPPINVVFTLEHDRNAAAVDATLRPTKLIVFGNPSLGTVLMQTDRSVALDLPQKILVYTDADGQTYVAFNDPGVIKNRHGLPGQQDILRTIRGALNNFAGVGS